MISSLPCLAGALTSNFPWCSIAALAVAWLAVAEGICTGQSVAVGGSVGGWADG